jgi:hypothetical protein
MEKTRTNVEKDLSRIAGLIAGIRYEEPPDSVAEMVLGKIRPKKLGLFKRLWRRLRTPLSVTPLKLLPTTVTAVAFLILAATLLWRAPVEKMITQSISQVSDRGLNMVMLTLDRPDASDVEVIGSFNGWAQEGVRMIWDRDRGLWVVALNLSRGSYEYAFRVNGKEIVADPKAILHRDDGFGHRNSILMVGNGNGNETRI